MDCRQEQNTRTCICTYPCERKGLCCECVAYHRRAGELPACYFDPRTERTYDRSWEAYARSQRGART